MSLQLISTANNVENVIFSHYLLLNRITDTKITNGGSGIRISCVDFFQKINKQERHLFRTQEYMDLLASNIC